MHSGCGVSATASLPGEVLSPAFVQRLRAETMFSAAEAPNFEREVNEDNWYLGCLSATVAF